MWQSVLFFVNGLHSYSNTMDAALMKKRPTYSSWKYKTEDRILLKSQYLFLLYFCAIIPINQIGINTNREEIDSSGGLNN